MMEPLIVRGSRLKLALLLLLCVPMDAAAIAALRSPGSFWGGLAGAVFFGLCTIGFAVAVIWFNPKPRYVIGPEGIRDLRLGLVPWSEVTGVGVRRKALTSFVWLTLRDPQVFSANQSTVMRSLESYNRSQGYGDLAVSLTGTDSSAKQVLAAVDKFWKAAT